MIVKRVTESESVLSKQGITAHFRARLQQLLFLCSRIYDDYNLQRTYIDYRVILFGAIFIEHILPLLSGEIRNLKKGKMAAQDLILDTFWCNRSPVENAEIAFQSYLAAQQFGGAPATGVCTVTCFYCLHFNSPRLIKCWVLIKNYVSTAFSSQKLYIYNYDKLNKFQNGLVLYLYSPPIIHSQKIKTVMIKSSNLLMFL